MNPNSNPIPGPDVRSETESRWPLDNLKIPRRTALMKAFWGIAAGCAAPACRPLPRADSSKGSTATTSHVPEVPGQLLPDSLDSDVNRLSQRAYSEEGIPVFLVCENLASKGAAARKLSAVTSENRMLAERFRQVTEIWARGHPDAGPGDVGKLIEFLAEQDFGNERHPR